MSLCKGLTQGGSNADVVLADAYLKNITNGVDWKTGYEAVVSDAEGKFKTALLYDMSDQASQTSLRIGQLKVAVGSRPGKLSATFQLTITIPMALDHSLARYPVQWNTPTMISVLQKWLRDLAIWRTPRNTLPGRIIGRTCIKLTRFHLYPTLQTSPTAPSTVDLSDSSNPDI